MSNARGGVRRGGLGIPGLTREDLSRGWAAMGGAPAPAVAWEDRHRQLAVASLHRWLARELVEGRRWPPPLGLPDLATLGREEFRAVLERLRAGASPLLARINVEAEIAEVEGRAASEPKA